MPNPQPIWAGTIPCPECGGEPVVHRHTPNWARLTQMEVPFDFKVRPPNTLSCGCRTSGLPQTPSQSAIQVYKALARTRA